MEFGVKDPYKKFKCLEPEHAKTDTDPSMSMYKDCSFVKCFGCNLTASIFTLASLLEGKPESGPDWVKDNLFYLADKYGIKYNIINNGAERAALKHSYLRAYKIVEDYITLTASKNPTEALEKEISKRKWKKKECIDLGLGCVNKFSEMISILESNGFSKEFIDMVGLNRADIFNSDSVIFTIYDELSRPIAFYSRDTKFEEKKAKYDEESLDIADAYKPRKPMKYNSTANFPGIYEKPLYPYGLHDIRNFHKIILVEGHSCKMSLRLNGIDNVIALGGLEFSEATINKLISLGVTAFVLLLDNDSRGIQKVKSIINKYYGKISVDLYVIDISSFTDVKDPDEFLRKYSADAFRSLPEKNALEWFAINELCENSDPYTVIESLSNLIALERSPINRLRIEDVISDMTNIEKNVIHAEVEQKISLSKDRKSEYALKIFEEARDLVSMNPNAIEAAMNLIDTKIGALNNNSDDDDLYSANETLKALSLMEEMEDNGLQIPIIKTGIYELDKYSPIPANEAFIIVPASPNAMKSTLFVNLADNILDLNEDTVVLIHTIDDSRNVYLNRLLAKRTNIPMNWLKNPNYYLDDEMNKKRKEAYQYLSDLIISGRLIIKDIRHGNSVEYHTRLVQKTRDKIGSKNLVVFCDNFHKLTTSAVENEKDKWPYISSMIKSATTKYGCVEFNTVELNKNDMYIRHTDPNTIKETGSIQYDANMIIFLWNEINALRENATLYHESKVLDYDEQVGYYHRTENKPVIEGIILKNKLSDYKKSIFLKGHPETALLEDISTREVLELQKQNIKKMKEKE